MKNITEAAQGDYYAFMNPHVTAIAKGGKNQSAGTQGYEYMIPKNRCAYYKYFTEFHYAREGTAYKPIVRLTLRLEKTTNTASTRLYDDYVRANGDVGVGGLLLIGRPS